MSEAFLYVLQAAVPLASRGSVYIQRVRQRTYGGCQFFLEIKKTYKSNRMPVCVSACTEGSC